jgi:hypothetical protein
MEARYDHPVSGETAGNNAVSDWLDPQIGIGTTGDSVTATATIDVPSVIPGVNIFGPVRRSATMPKEDTTS